MKAIRSNLALRYVVAMALTCALMIWISINEEGSRQAIPGQIVFWSIAITAGWLQMILISRGVRATFGTEMVAGWVLLMATAIIGAVPLTFEVRFLLDAIVAPVRGLPPPWLTYLNVMVINLVFCLVQYILIERWPLFDEHKKDQAEGVSTPAEEGGSTDIRPNVARLERRPEGLSGIIQFMRMEDHYLHVHTNEGTGMMLHRMSDAKRELTNTDGLQVHKSWWVSAAAVDEIRHENRKRVIRTKDGTEIPVGRSFEGALKSAGWI
ncbi:LytTR family DNA-binding domain-containing protein [Shimia sp.]|uniref:LytTR family DNA-binding domain-containing protein n=1 Tax=Shimia sp. TaxID=1954381 RepID=UPI003296D75C